VAQQYCSTCDVKLGGGLQLQAVSELLGSLPAGCNPPSLAWLHHQPYTPPPPQPASTAAPLPTTPTTSPATSPPDNQPTSTTTSTTSQQEQQQQQQQQQQQKQQQLYSEPQLNTLALLFTSVKLLLLNGALPAAQRLLQLVEPARLASATPLHQTLLRNEAAYYGCVRQLLLEQPPPAQPIPGNPAPLYLCGDSHCLSGEGRRAEERRLGVGSRW
jgi:hypothetical protein